MAVASWADEQLSVLRPLYAGRWDIWHVRNLYPKPHYTWCAKPAGAPIATIHADTPERLVQYIAEAEGEARR